MRILILVDREVHARESARAVSSEVKVTVGPRVRVEKGGSVVDFFVLRNENDAERLRGLRYDLVVEHESFNFGRSYIVGAAAELAKQIVLR